MLQTTINVYMHWNDNLISQLIPACLYYRMTQLIFLYYITAVNILIEQSPCALIEQSLLNYSNRTINTLISMNGDAKQTLTNANVLAIIILSLCDIYELMFKTIPCMCE